MIISAFSSHFNIELPALHLDDDSICKRLDSGQGTVFSNRRITMMIIMTMVYNNSYNCEGIRRQIYCQL